MLAVLAYTDIEEIPIVADTTFENYELVVHNLQVLLIVLALAVVAAIGLLVAIVVVARYEKLELEKVLWQGREQHYRNLEQSQFKISRLRHDMANHLTAMTGLNDAEMRCYLDRLVESPAMKTERRFCENEVANAVLTSKVFLMEEAQIPYKIEMELGKDIPVVDVDLCALFANALDNAIEASRKMPVEDRMVVAHAKAGNGLFMLEVRNQANATPKWQNGQIVTSKKDKLHHGFGLASIREVAERYGGICREDFIDSTFRLHVTIPLSLGN